MVAISSNDIRFYLSGGSSNTNPNSSLGGVISSQSIINDQLNNLFDNVTKVESDIGDIEYRCFYVKNTNTTDTMANMVVYLQDGTDSSEDTVFYGLGTSCIGGVEQSIASEGIAPSGNIVFTNAKKRADGYLIGSLAPNAHKAIWLKRVVDVSAGSFKRNKFRLRFETSPGISVQPCPAGFHRDSVGVCVPDISAPCAAGFHKDANDNCVPDIVPCQAGFHRDPISNECVPDNSNPPPPVVDFSFTAVGDNSCNDTAKGIVNKMLARKPDIHLQLGDNSYTSSTTCYRNMMEPFKTVVHGIVTKSALYQVCIGNHDDAEDESNSLRDGYLSWMGLLAPYHSFNYQNVHFINLYTFADFGYGTSSNQYKFAKSDLEAASANPNIDWIIAIFHKPIYCSSSTHGPESSFRTIYHPLFDKHKVDLCLSGHNHNYQRTYPLKFGSGDSPTIITTAKTGYTNLVNPIFVTVGGGGRGLYSLGSSKGYLVRHDKTHCYVYVTMSDGGRKLTVKAYKSNDSLIEEFTIQKTLPSAAADPVLNQIELSTEMSAVADCAPPPGPTPCATPAPQTINVWYGTCRAFNNAGIYDNYTDTIGHEIVEIQTDPNVTLGSAHQGWTSDSVANVRGRDEIADGCQSTHRFGTAPDDLLMQGYWSNSDGGCVIPDFITTGPGVNNKYIYRGGVTLPNAKVYLIYWGSLWATRTTAPTMAGLTEKVQTKMLNTYVAYFSKLSQYSGIVAPTWGGAVNNLTLPIPTAVDITQDHIKQLLTDTFNTCLLPVPTPNNQDMYIVIPPFGKGVAIANTLGGIVSTPNGFHGALTLSLGGQNPPPPPGPTPGGGNGPDGVRMIYSTKADGDTFFWNDSNPTINGRFDWNGAGTHKKLSGQEGWHVADSGNIRLLVFTKNNSQSNLSDNDRSPGGKMTSFNYATLKTTGHFYQARDWKNIEATIYIRVTGGDSSSHDEAGFSFRSVRHKSNSGSASVGSIGCGGSAYHSNIFASNGKFRFKKEQWHVDYDSKNPSSKSIGDVHNKWIGHKFALYNASNGDVVLETWADKNATNNWELIESMRDSDNWGSSMTNCGAAKKGEAIRWGSPMAILMKCVGWQFDMKKVSIREISPPS